MLKTNADPIRIKILQLEAAPTFDAEAWQRVLADLRAQDRPAALADARRRMATAEGHAGAGRMVVLHALADVDA